MKKILLRITIIILLMVVGGVGYSVYQNNNQTQTQQKEPMTDNIGVSYDSGGNGPICTGEAKSCGDGTFVGRIAPNCEFAKCPGFEPKEDFVPTEANLIQLPDNVMTVKECTLQGGEVFNILGETTYNGELIGKITELRCPCVCLVKSSKANTVLNSEQLDGTENIHYENTPKQSSSNVVDLIQSTTPQNKSYEKILLAPENNKIYFGAFPDFGGSEDIVTIKRIKDFEELVGKEIVWAYFSQNWFNGIRYPKESIHIINNEGIIPFVRLMSRSDEEQFKKEKKFSLENIINGKFDKELRKWARDSKEDNIPLLVDFAVEMNGDWFSWSGIYNGKGTKNKYGDPNYPDGPEKYRDAYRHIIDIFKEENVNHITWFFHPDIYSNPDLSWNQPKYYYPGDDYIDWIGISIYGPQNPDEDYWETFSEILENRYKSITEISQNKPIALLEFGVTDNHPLGKKDEWLNDAFETILNNPYIDFKAISYWHENWEEDDNLLATIRVDSSKESLETFRELVKNSRFTSNKILSNLSGHLLTKKTGISLKEVKNKFDDKSKILFKSGFEDGVYLEEVIADDGGIWWQQIKGSDISGYSWPITILGNKGKLQLIVDYDKEIDEYIENKIETVVGKDGKPTKALHQIIKNKQYEYTQDPYIIYTNNTEVEDLYIKYFLKLPENTPELLGDDGWTAITEFKTTSDYRLALYIYQENGNLYWYVHGDSVVEDESNYEEFWSIENRKIPVPVGEWFDMEISWHRSKNDDGRVLWKVNSKTIADYSGETKIKDPLNAIMLFTNYASNPFHQWIDNIEIRDEFINS